MSDDQFDLEKYEEMWVLPNTILAFRIHPNREEINEVRKVLDSLEEML
jgi:hypothetical protein